MSSLRETKNRIRSVKNTEKITRAMKMVAASKLRKAQEEVVKPRGYVAELTKLLAMLAKKNLASDSSHPLLEKRENFKNIEILAITSDRGLCGSLNSSIIRAVHAFIHERDDAVDNFYISSIGKKGFDALNKHKYGVRKNHNIAYQEWSIEKADEIATDFCHRFLKSELDAVYLFYNEFKSAINQEVKIKQLLPVSHSEEKVDLGEFIFEPKEEKLLDFIVPKYFTSLIYQSYLESFASEQGARMTAMDNATRNAKEMTDKLTLQYNRARQAAITKELMEIIGGAEAL